MKNLLIAFLLAIFSVQGIVVAMGDDISGHVQVPATNPVADLPSSCCDGNEAELQQVFVTIEELSDYVPFDLPVSNGPNQVVESSSLPVFLLSTDLPRIKPPPRA